MSESTAVGGAVRGGPAWWEPVGAPPPPEPPPPPARPGLPAGLAAFLGVAMAGVVLMLAGLAVDAVVHARDPGAHSESGPFGFANPGHVVLVLGGVLTVGGLTGATVRALALSTRPRLSSPIVGASLVTAVVLLAATTAATVRWASRAEPPLASGPLAPAAGPDAHGIGIVNSHDPGNCRPTREQKAAAAKLVSDTERGTARYRSFEAALADGFTGPASPTVTEHYSNGAHILDGRTLDPARPESLMYAPTSRGMVLVGVMYMMNVPGEFGPEVGGCLTRWHVHTNVCFSATTFAIAGTLERPEDACQPGTFRWIPPPVLHVWLIDVPGGRFAAEVDPAVIARAVGP